MEEKKFIPRGLQRQIDFLTKIASYDLACPCCKENHSYIELRNNDLSVWENEAERGQYPSTGDVAIFCPVTKRQMVYMVEHTMFDARYSLVEIPEDL